MKINLPTEKKVNNYQIGDVVVLATTGSAYFIFKNPATKEYSLLKEDMQTYATGRHASLEALVLEMERLSGNVTHYPKKDYTLNVVRKEVN
ncbi:hypothetical protein HOBO_229 [Bacillus phage Hobo]|uniref:Uncharacterized protein n=2 Tax=Caeruleovirus BM15 TaxID=1985178 RepID=A0A0S2MUZ3_9CAUD|nr:hypothetical protein FD732_gp112 [Bacillus phage BM15]ALO79637.1 hypothetical protein BM10_233 [Bacillus phage BM15]AXQ66984.1 hypothetical protein HOBO_229 [Bacillus phage Hobo]